MQKLTQVALAALLSTALLSCGGGSEATAPPPVLTTLNLSVSQTTIIVGQSANASVTGVDQFGAPIATGAVSWTTASGAIAIVSQTGVVTGVAAGQTDLTASAGAKLAHTSITVIPVPVASVAVTPGTVTITAGATQQLTASTLDASLNVLPGRAVAWSSSDVSRATVNATGLVTAVAAGVAIVTATSEGKSGSAQITVNAQVTCAGATLQLSVGEVRVLAASEKASMCVGGGASPSEYALIPFNNTNVAASTIPIRLSATGTSTIVPGSLASVQMTRNVGLKSPTAVAVSYEWAFRQREHRDLASLFNSARRPPGSATVQPPAFLTGIPANPTVGSVVDINANLTGNTCSAAKQLHGAIVVAVLPHTIVLSDTTAPAGGYTAVEMTSFGMQFDTLGYALDVQNFGAPTDIDANGRIAILFTPGINVIPAPPGAFVGGLFADRDLFPVTTCAASNEGEIFYLPVPDPNSTINGNYAVKANVARGTLGALVHEFQHLINSGRRVYVNNASSFEEIWLNEGLSHIAEELLYYRISGNAPRSNIDLSVLQSSQAQLDAANAYAIQNMGRLSTYMKAPESNSPFGQTDLLEMRGAIWQLLRYAADRKGGLEQNTWSALVNSTTSGQANFNAVFGDIIGMSRDWVVAQFLDDAGLGAAPNYTHPSWNYRSILPPINQNKFPLLTRALLDVPLDITLNGGSASYIRFRVLANAPASISANSSGQPIPAAVDFILIRTQ
jgi:Big-like domain-containing protein